MKHIDKKLARTVLEANRSDGEYAKVKDEINLRSTLAVIYQTGAICDFETKLFNNDLVIVMENKKKIRINFQVFCSENWKNRILSDYKLINSINTYSSLWYKVSSKTILKRFIASLSILLATIAILLYGISSLPTGKALITVTLIAIGIHKCVTDFIHNKKSHNNIFDKAISVRIALSEKEMEEIND
jgi:hypothetical protein